MSVLLLHRIPPCACASGGGGAEINAFFFRRKICFRCSYPMSYYMIVDEKLTLIVLSNLKMILFVDNISVMVKLV